MTQAQRIAALEALHPAGTPKGHHTHTPPPEPTPVPPTGTHTFEANFDTMPAQFVSQYGAGDPGDRQDTDMSAPMTTQQSSLSGGILTMACERKSTPSGRPFAGACWSTYGRFSQKYGTFECRIRFDEAERTWPALWLLPVGQKAPYPEVDWVEAYGSPARLGPGQLEHIVHHTPGQPGAYVVKPLTNSAWHVHKMVWTATRIDFYIDGALSWSFTDAAKVPQVPMYPILTMGVDPVNATGPAPDRTVMQVDYLRVSV